ncbi:MAG: hypothetical protein JSR71_07990 [Proteobacteria bacterium]|nr:hypothetical protein [Pseudomonadota bacterium]
MKTIALSICSLFLVFTSLSSFSSYSTFAGFDDLSEAILHTYSASKSENGKVVAKHAEIARIHASATRNDNDRRVNHDLLNEGIRYLNLAAQEGKNGNTDAAKQAINNALLFLIESVNMPVVFRRINDDG